jgi:hypothetical protein
MQRLTLLNWDPSWRIEPDVEFLLNRQKEIAAQLKSTWHPPRSKRAKSEALASCRQRINDSGR